MGLDGMVGSGIWNASVVLGVMDGWMNGIWRSNN
jgi:hypothetical protein